MERRAFGKSGLSVSCVGFGAGHIGGDTMEEAAVERTLHQVLDLGINLIDTARGYGRSEERIGRYLSHRRSEFILSTKIGYGVEGVADWSPEIIPAGITQALRRLRTDYLDIVHLHSCPTSTLKNSDLLQALAREVSSGRVRVAAYSGENDDLAYAIRTGVFGSVQCSVNLFDQRSIRQHLPDAAAAGLVSSPNARSPMPPGVLLSNRRVTMPRPIGCGCGRWDWILVTWSGPSSLFGLFYPCPEYIRASSERPMLNT